MTEVIENLKSVDPFAEEDGGTGQVGQSQQYIHVRIQQRNGRKNLTTVQGLPSTVDVEKTLKEFRKRFACNGHLVEDPKMGSVIQMQGDKRDDAIRYLTKEKNIPRDNIIRHGF